MRCHAFFTFAALLFFTPISINTAYAGPGACSFESWLSIEGGGSTQYIGTFGVQPGSEMAITDVARSLIPSDAPEITVSVGLTSPENTSVQIDLFSKGDSAKIIQKHYIPPLYRLDIPNVYTESASYTQEDGTNISISPVCETRTDDNYYRLLTITLSGPRITELKTAELEIGANLQPNVARTNFNFMFPNRNSVTYEDQNGFFIVVPAANGDYLANGNWELAGNGFTAFMHLPEPACADTDGNGKVDIFDLNKILICFLQAPVGFCSGSDLDLNNKVDIFDLNSVLTQFGDKCNLTLSSGGGSGGGIESPAPKKKAAKSKKRAKHGRMAKHRARGH